MILSQNQYKDMRQHGMTAYEFFELCSNHCIEPDIALENANLKEAVELGQYNKIETILKEEF